MRAGVAVAQALALATVVGLLVAYSMKQSGGDVREAGKQLGFQHRARRDILEVAVATPAMPLLLKSQRVSVEMPATMPTGPSLIDLLMKNAAIKAAERDAWFEAKWVLWFSACVFACMSVCLHAVQLASDRDGLVPALRLSQYPACCLTRDGLCQPCG